MALNRDGSKAPEDAVVHELYHARLRSASHGITYHSHDPRILSLTSGDLGPPHDSREAGDGAAALLVDG